MKDANVDLMPVLQDGKLVGVLDEDAISDSGAGDPKKQVGELMRKPLFVEERITIDDAVKYLIEHSLSRLPVVESRASMRCAGIVGATELLRAKKQP